jgi:hypothetical protein
MFCLSTFLALSVPNADYSVNVLPFNLFGFERIQCRLFRTCFAFQLFGFERTQCRLFSKCFAFQPFGFERTQCRFFSKCFAFQPFWL